MNSGHLGTAVFWVGLLTLFGWQASADQVLRPPLPIPNVVTPAPVAIRPPVIAPIPVPPARPIPVAVPPVEYDHEYKGKLTILRPDDYLLIRIVCSDATDPIACSFRTFDTTTGTTLSCVILLGPKVHDDERALRHEMGHCLGWPSDHPGARYGD